LATTLQAVNRYAAKVTAVVSVADDGGSSGRLRQSQGIPAPGDLRRCLVALADPDSVWAQAFEYRFPAGELQGHALGNLVIAGLADLGGGGFAEAIEHAAVLLGVAGRVLPATRGPVVLKADVAGQDVVGQMNVSEALAPISSVSVVPADAPAPQEALAAVLEADQVVIGPGSLFTSVLAACVVPGIRDALAARRGGRVYICNLHCEEPETAGLSAAGHVRALAAHGVPVDHVILDPTAALPPSDLRPDDPGGPFPPALHVIETHVARPDGLAHSPERLAGALRALLEELDGSAGIG
jgi:uncharacterized cofD-like protein